jgi:hypothetical protein
VGARRLGQDEQYFTVREIQSEASTLADGALSRERKAFYRFGYATLGFLLDNLENWALPSSKRPKGYLLSAHATVFQYWKKQ